MRCTLDCFQCPYPDCIANGDRIISRNYGSLTPEQVQRMKDHKRERYKIRKEKGLCPTCGAVATHGILCERCYLKKKDKDAKREAKKIEWGRQGLCLKCGSRRTDGSQYCMRHTEALERQREYDRIRKRQERVDSKIS